MGMTAAVVSMVGTAYGVYSGMQAAEEQEKAAAEAERIARDNAAAIEAETMETKRRTSAAQAETESAARARAAASGVQLTGSTGMYLEEMQTEHGRQLEWLTKSGKSKADITRAGGAYTAAAGMAGAASTRASAIGGGISGLASVAKGKGEWW